MIPATVGALVIVAFTMMATYVNDVVAPLKTMLETDLAWSSTDFGFFTGGYSFLNVFPDVDLGRINPRPLVSVSPGKLATILMVGGTALEYYAMTDLPVPTRLYSESMKYLAIKRCVCYFASCYFGVRQGRRYYSFQNHSQVV